MGRQIQDPVVIGIDVGSTTVKAVVLDPETLEILWSDYQRHQTKQPEKVLELIEQIESTFPGSPRDRWRVFMTGSGAAVATSGNASAAAPTRPQSNVFILPFLSGQRENAPHRPVTRCELPAAYSCRPAKTTPALSHATVSHA